jgi:hypothetical protein
MTEKPMDKVTEYKCLQELELDMTRVRHNTFTALISVSFLLPGLALQADRSSKLPLVSLLGRSYEIDKVIFMLGFIFYCFTVFHYWWYHRYSHLYRKRLKELEIDLNINIYRLRQRKVFSTRLGLHKLHFDWSIYILGIIYGFVALSFVGRYLFVCSIAPVLLLYALLVLNSAQRPTEPLEVGKHGRE